MMNLSIRLLLLAALISSLASAGVAGDRVLFLIGENDYGSQETMPAFARELEEALDVQVEVRLGTDQGMPSLEGLEDFDLLVLFLGFRAASPQERAVFDRWFAAGNPAVALRTTSHAFADDPSWFPPHFGGHYKGHAPDDDGTRAVCDPRQVNHPILNGVPRVLEFGQGGTYDTQPLAEGAVPLMFGRTGERPAQPIAWTYGRRFYTSLGSQSDFDSKGFRQLLANAVLWGLGQEVPARGFLSGLRHERADAVAQPPNAPPRRRAPKGATVLFAGKSAAAWKHYDPSTPPVSMHIDARADTTAGGPTYDEGRWATERSTLVARPGFGDLISRESFGDYHLHLDFSIPREPTWVPDDFRGSSGVYLGGRWEIQLVDSWNEGADVHSLGALHGQVAPASNAARPPGEWQSLDLTLTQRARQLPRLSAWVNDVRVLTDVTPEEATAYGILQPIRGSEASGEAWHVERGDNANLVKWGNAGFSLHAAFRTRQSGTLVSKCPPAGSWVPDAKALFIRGGRLVYDIGWLGAIVSEQVVNDGEWHRVVLTSENGSARLFLDGELAGEREAFTVEDQAEFVLKVGAANDDFGGTYAGDLRDVRYYDRRLSAQQAMDMSRGSDPAPEPVWSWKGAAGELAAPIEENPPLTAPIRLQADTSPVRFANIWVAPLGEVDHAGLIASLDRDAYDRGEEIYRGLCHACHGDDGRRTLNPKARAFANAPLQNGADPLSLYKTIGDGFRDMPSNSHLTPSERYDVIHFLRERFLKEENPTQYVEASEAYLAALPKGRQGRRASQVQPELAPRDFGPALASQLGRRVGAALTVRLDDRTAISYDTQTLECAGVWSGGFLDLSKTQHYQQRGEGEAQPGGDELDGLAAYGWGHGGRLDWDRGRRPERGLLPLEWLDYHGHFVHGERAVLHYSIDGRPVWESPGVDRSSGLEVIRHRLALEASDTELLLSLIEAPRHGEGEATTHFQLRKPDKNGLGWALAGFRRKSGEFAATAVLGDVGQLEPVEDGIALRIPGGSTELMVLRVTGTTPAELAAFALFLDNLRERELPPSPRVWTSGGPSRWHALETTGQLGEGAGAYVVDTIELPEDNPWNAWIRTSAIAFFEDGRAAVTTYGGDVWIVSGLDDDLEDVTWRRLAAGLFEPMGVQVVDGKVLVCGRDRITRLHDLNDDGEADYYESFFADPDVSPTFHAFNFDLQRDAAGNLYYAKAGQYTSYALPGAVLKIAPDGKSHEILCTGLRTPNGMGMLPDGRVTVSDNQGNWIPASKISLVKPGGFYGVFKAIDVGTPGVPTQDHFDPPLVWMPQSLDSSSGGQLWVDDPRWGPLSRRLLHTSFGKGWLYPLSIDERGAEPQGAIWRFPHQFAAGLQRGRVNPADGQVYVVGLSGWQGPAQGRDGCLQRVRYTGIEETLLLDARVGPGTLELTFSAPLDSASSKDLARYRVRRWNYRWSRDYGSAHYSVSRPDQEGEDEVVVVVVRLSASGKQLTLVLADLVPCDQLELVARCSDQEGRSLEQRVYFTVHQVTGN